MSSHLFLIFSILITSIHQSAGPDKPFTGTEFVGEIMHYNLKYGIFNIGVATISCLEDQAESGYIITAEAQSTGLLRIFKDLNYRFECCMDPATGLPNSAIMDLRDGNNTVYRTSVFDRCSRTDSTIVISQTLGELIAPKDIYDILSGYYHFRKDFLAQSIINKHPVVIQTFIADMFWDLRLKYTGGESINTMYGQIPCSRFSSSTVVGGFFKNDDDMIVWFTKDEMPIPVKIELNLKIGSIKGELEGYQMPANAYNQF
jgi:hypothetical protein